MSHQQPTIFLSHGPGPAWLLNKEDLPGSLAEVDKTSKPSRFLQGLMSTLNIAKPSAILVISAHWEEPQHAVSTHSKPPLFFDYYGFPEKSYNVTWPVPGSPELARKAMELLLEAGITCTENGQRGLDHGTFVPLKLALPNADIPVFQLCLKSGLSLEHHAKVGQALAPLRQEGVLIVGSGHSTHPISSGGQSATPAPWATSFRAWLHDVISNDQYAPQERQAKLLASASQETFHKAHPRTEHYVPLIVVAAAARFTHGDILYDEFIFGDLLVGHYRFN